MPDANLTYISCKSMVSSELDTDQGEDIKDKYKICSQTAQ